MFLQIIVVSILLVVLARLGRVQQPVDHIEHCAAWQNATGLGKVHLRRPAAARVRAKGRVGERTIGVALVELHRIQTHAIAHFVRHKGYCRAGKGVAPLPPQAGFIYTEAAVQAMEAGELTAGEDG